MTAKHNQTTESVSLREDTPVCTAPASGRDAVTEPASAVSAPGTSSRLARRAYEDQNDTSAREQQIVRYLPLVHKVVQRVTSYLKSPLTYDDLISAGTVGLVKAAQNYDLAKQAEFQTYAYIKIRGAVLDELRAWSFVPASMEKQIQETFQTSLDIMETTGKSPSDDVLAERLQISVDKLYDIFKHARTRHFLSLDQTRDDLSVCESVPDPAQDQTPQDQLEQRELIEALTHAIQRLDQKQRQIILLYYQQDMTMKQIADVFGITESRVSQLHAKALFTLSTDMKEWNDGRE